jgi:hypothetical protein
MTLKEPGLTLTQFLYHICTHHTQKRGLPPGLTHHHRHTQESHTERRRDDLGTASLDSELLWCNATEVPSLEAPPLLFV